MEPQKVRIRITADVDLELTEGVSVSEAIERFGVSDSWYMLDVYCTACTVINWSSQNMDTDEKERY